jgi:hypothetical protein
VLPGRHRRHSPQREAETLATGDLRPAAALGRVVAGQDEDTVESLGNETGPTKLDSHFPLETKVPAMHRGMMVQSVELEQMLQWQGFREKKRCSKSWSSLYLENLLVQSCWYIQ